MEYGPQYFWLTRRTMATFKTIALVKTLFLCRQLYFCEDDPFAFESRLFLAMANIASMPLPTLLWQTKQKLHATLTAVTFRDGWLEANCLRPASPPLPLSWRHDDDGGATKTCGWSAAGKLEPGWQRLGTDAPGEHRGISTAKVTSRGYW